MKMQPESSDSDFVKIGHSHFDEIGNEIGDKILYWQI
jgi:hypothetical protein